MWRWTALLHGRAARTRPPLTIRAFGRVGHGAAGWLLVPYLCWVSYATALNAWIVLAN